MGRVMTMKCDKCIHKSVCWMRKQATVDVLEKMEQCCCYVEVDDPDEFIVKGDIDDIKHHPVIKAFKVEYTHVVYTPDIQVKAIPIKSHTLCEKCFYHWEEHCMKRQNKICIGCPLDNPNETVCECSKISHGKPCRNFKRKESGADNGK